MLFELVLQASGRARKPAIYPIGTYVEGVGLHRRLGIVSIYPYRAHTAEEPVGDGPRGRCYGPVNPTSLEEYTVVLFRVGKGLMMIP